MVEVDLFPQQLSERLPNRTSRYDDHRAMDTKTTIIPAGPFNPKINIANLETVTIPDGWKKYSNPAEGRVYFRNSSLRLMTEAFIQHAIILERINYWYKLIIPYLNAFGQTFDIFLDVMETAGEAMGPCSYYLVDYAAQSVFWLRDISTSILGLPDVRNAVHLKHLLSEQFWTHCEYMPRDDTESISHANELLASLGTLALDASTSTGSVSPFHPDECETYSRALKQVIETKVMIDINWCTARIMSLLAQSRTINLHGELGARTDRAMVVSGQYPPQHTRVFELFSKALFGIPTLYLNRWNGLWVDRIAYTREWRRVVREITQEWLYAVIYAGVLIIPNVGLLGTTSSIMVRILSGISALQAIIGGAHGIMLLSEHRILGHCAADAANFIQTYETATHGLQNLSIRHSIPWAALIWSLLFLFISFLWLIFYDMITLIKPVVQVVVQENVRNVGVLVLLLITYFYGRGSISASDSQGPSSSHYRGYWRGLYRLLIG